MNTENNLSIIIQDVIELKKSSVLIIIFLCLLTLFTPCLAEGQEKQLRLINVSGEAEVQVVPDEVILTLGIETQHQDLETAKQLNDERIQKILAVTNKLKIEPKHTQTDYISIEPRYVDNYDKKSFIGFFVRKSLVITLKDISIFEKVLSGSLNAGANYVMGVQFRTTELRKYRDQARQLAIKAAEEKAVMLARELGEKVSRVYSITEQSNHWNSYNGWWGFRNGLTQNVIQNAGGTSGNDSDTIAPGQISIRATVLVSFELKE